ncbi:MAG TPA: hypothetical protein PKM97_11310 [Bacteroidia bacterium]|nr:hypothetical protein [Bacteroidia bacterium]
MRKLYILTGIAVFIIVSILSGCKKDQESVLTTNISFNGTAQKGPFLNGSSITVFELDQNFSQTGKSFSTQITDNLGSFQINSATLISNYISLRADGFYFNEICGSNSISQITLNGISDISNATARHVNILTHLEKPRVEYLLGTGVPFDSAKKVAQTDVLNIFNISSSGLANSEYFDISNPGVGNAILLAVSSIVQGFRSESELSSILAEISNDIRTDGVLNNNSSMSSLIDHAILLDTNSIRNNITNYYLNFGVTPSIPNFENHIQHFVTNSTFPITNSVINYPATGTYGDNILDKGQQVYTGSQFSMKANLKKCSQFKIRMQLISGSVWGNYISTTNNWNISVYDNISKEQFYTVANPEQPSDLKITFQAGGVYLIEYFDINLSTPSFSKTFSVN